MRQQRRAELDGALGAAAGDACARRQAAAAADETSDNDGLIVTRAAPPEPEPGSLSFTIRMPDNKGLAVAAATD